MNGLPYYKAYPRDFFEGTVGLPGDLKGAYRMALDLIYMHDGNLPDDAHYISGHLGYTVRQWGFHRKRLLELGKLFLRGAFIASSRADQELFATRSYREQQTFNGSQPKKNKHIREATAKRSLSHTDTDTDTERKEDPPLTPQMPALKVAPSALVSEFERIWPHYPRQVGVGAARKAWVKARAKASYEEIAASLRVFIPAVKGTPIDKVPHFATWLNGERWNDDHTHAANRGLTSADDLRGLATISAAEDIARLMAPPPLKAIGQ